MGGRTGRGTLACLLGFALVAAACADDDTEAGGGGSGGGGFEEGTFTFAVNAELSGAIDGTPMERGVQAYANEVNAEGGIDGHEVEVVALDTAADQARAAANTTQLVTSGDVTAIFGHLLSANCTASTPIVERAEIPMACLSVAEANPWVYNLGPDNSLAADAFVAAGAEVAEPAGGEGPRMALAYSTTLTNEALAEDVPDAADAAGAELTASEGIAPNASDMSGPAAALVESDPDVILVTTIGPAALIRAIRSAGFEGPVVGLEGSAGLNLYDDSDPNLYVMSVYRFPDPESDDPVVQRYIESLSTVEEDLGSFASYSNGEIVPVYLTAAAFGDALERCGYPCPGPDLQEHLDETSVDFGELVPAFEYDGDDHYPYPNWFLYRVQPDAVELVAELPQEG
jgi:branched-chain amino acid transport system substrate-binding protein